MAIMSSPEDTPTTAGAEVFFRDGTSQKWGMNPSLELTTKDAPWLPEVVNLMMQGDVLAVSAVDIPVEDM